MEKTLKCGTVLIFDEADLPIINSHNWQSNNGYIFYTKSIDGKMTRFYLHRVLTGASEGLVVDHINGNPSDNRRENLRICKVKDNARNRAKPRTGSLSAYKGVKPRCGKYEASIGRTKSEYEYLGVYETELDAAIAYNIAASKKYGEFARLNEIPFDYSNYIPQRVVGTSVYRGVSYSTTFGKWIAKLQVNKKRRHLGYYDDEISAAMAYNEVALRELGDKAKLNVINNV